MLPPPPTVVVSPCAACKILRRRCVDTCVLAPYFPPTEPLKFAAVHRIFGAGNVIKFLQKLPENQRADATSSLVYEANTRLRDPVYGCAGVFFLLQNQVNELHAQLAVTNVEIHKMQLQHANLITLIHTKTSQLRNLEDPILCKEHFSFTDFNPLPRNESFDIVGEPL